MLIHNADITGSLLVNGIPYNTGSFSGSFTGIVAGTTATASYVEYTNVANKPTLVSGSSQISEFGIFATTGSNGFNGSQSITGSLTVTGQVVAQTLNVQQVTSSVVYSSGSNVFGNELGNTQQFTGSVSVTGSLAVGGVTNIGTRSGGNIRNLNIYGATNTNAIIKIDGADGNGYGAQIDFVSKQTGGTSNTWVLGTGINGGTNAFELYNGSSTSLSINLSGSVGIGTTSQRGVLDISSGLRTGTLSGLFVGADVDTTAGTRTNNTRKVGMIASPHYENASSSVFGISMDNQVSNNFIYIGGGYSGYNAATAIVFSTGATTTTETGTERMRISSGGQITVTGNGSGQTSEGIFFKRTSNLAQGGYISGNGGALNIVATNEHSSANGTIYFQRYNGTTTTPSMIIDGNGVVLINNTYASPYGVLNTYKLPVNSTYVDQIVVQGAGNYPSLRLGTYDQYDGVIATTGNDLRILSGLNVSSENHNIRFYTSFNGAGGAAENNERMRIEYNGKVGIGVVSPNYSLTVSGTIQCGYIALGDIFNNNNSTIEFVNGPNSTTYASTGNITYYGNTNLTLCYGGGNVLIGTLNNYGAKVHASHASSGYPVFSAINTSVANSRCYYGQKYNSSTDDYYMIFDNAVANKFLFYGNGGLGNVQANNINLSDERVKKDITPLESYWDKFKKIEIVKFKYKDQTHDDFNIGVIAQQVELVAPEFIEAEDWGKDTPAQSEEPLKSVYTTDLYHATIKVLQECMSKIEEQQAQIEILKAEIQTLKQQ